MTHHFKRLFSLLLRLGVTLLVFCNLNPLGLPLLTLFVRSAQNDALSRACKRTP